MFLRKWSLSYRKATFAVCCGSLTTLLLVIAQLPGNVHRTSSPTTWEGDPGTIHTHIPPSEGLQTPPPRTLQNFTRENVCLNGTRRSVKELDSDQTRMLYQQIIVNDEYGFLYCAVPKVACSNWKRVIRVLNGQWETPDAQRKMYHRSGFKFLSDYKKEEREHRLKHYYKFMFVRHPLYRLLSAYRDKFGRPEMAFVERFGPHILKNYRQGVPLPSNSSDFRITFGEFVKFLLDSPVNKMDQHWRPIHEICQPCAVNYTFIGKFENLHSDAEQIFKELYVQDLVSFPQRQSYYDNTTTTRIKAEEFLTVPKEDFRQLVAKYSMDFSMFSYTTENVIEL